MAGVPKTPTKLVTSTMASTLIPTMPPSTIPPRKFNPQEYHHYRHLHGMPKEIPQITGLHYASMIIPVVLLLALYVHHREQNSKDLAEERGKTKRIKWLLFIGLIFATLIVCVHLRIIPVTWVRRIFPRWKMPPPMPKYMKVLIVFCFIAFIVYPTVKFIRRRNVPEGKPEIHKLMHKE